MLKSIKKDKLMTKKNKKLKTNSVSTLPIFSQTFTPEVNAEIRRAATTDI